MNWRERKLDEYGHETRNVDMNSKLSEETKAFIAIIFVFGFIWLTFIVVGIAHGHTMSDYVEFHRGFFDRLFK